MARSRSLLRIGLMLLAAPTLMITASSASSDDERVCRASCEERNKQCVEICSEGSNPIECEAECHEERQECIEEC